VIIDLHQRLQAQRQTRHGDLRDTSVADAAAALRGRRGAGAPRGVGGAGAVPAGLPRADADSRRELGWACALHEMG
jgi:exopolyphosphatase/guanosine-5'-triphosphate,3'-diphosphate pyrophosphatase